MKMSMDADTAKTRGARTSQRKAADGRCARTEAEEMGIGAPACDAAAKIENPKMACDEVAEMADLETECNAIACEVATAAEVLEMAGIEPINDASAAIIEADMDAVAGMDTRASMDARSGETRMEDDDASAEIAETDVAGSARERALGRMALLADIFLMMGERDTRENEEAIYRYGSMIEEPDLAARRMFIWLLDLLKQPA